MTIKITRDDTGNTFVIDDTTGEFYSVGDGKRPVKHGSGDKLIGIETKWPRQCLTADSFYDTISCIDGYVDNKPNINHDYLLKSVSHGYMTPQEARLVDWLAVRLTGWNRWYGLITECADGSGIRQDNFARTLKRLSPANIRVVFRDKPDRGDLVIDVHPYMAWKGDRRWQDYMIGRWYE